MCKLNDVEGLARVALFGRHGARAELEGGMLDNGHGQLFMAQFENAQELLLSIRPNGQSIRLTLYENSQCCTYTQRKFGQLYVLRRGSRSMRFRALAMPTTTRRDPGRSVQSKRR